MRRRETVLCDHPAVEEAACVVTGENPEQRRLQVSVTLNGSASCDARALRLYAMERLQRHAVPEQIDILPSFPRTSTGKIDRQRLPVNALRAVASEGQSL